VVAPHAKASWIHVGTFAAPTAYSATFHTVRVTLFGARL
jgi:hypothetical protein